MPFKDPKAQKEYKKKYDQKTRELIHEGKKALGIPIDKRKKPTV